jgi:hypothetical protein
MIPFEDEDGSITLTFLFSYVGFSKPTNVLILASKCSINLARK